MNSVITATLRLFATVTMAAMVSACSGDDAGTLQPQNPVEEPKVVGNSAIVYMRTATGLSPLSPEFAIRQPGAIKIPLITVPGSPEAALTEPVAFAAHAEAPNGVFSDVSTASFKTVTTTVEDILEHGLRLAPVDIQVLRE